MRWPSRTSSPCTRRCPQVGFSVAIRMTSFVIAAGVDGRPGRRRAVSSQLRETSLRWQARIVAGVTPKTSLQRQRGSSRDKAASHTRSAGV
jgi:hypothetical protein